MKAYLDLLQVIKNKGVHKPAAREGMPGTTSLFGYQFRHDLSEGFPLLTTKKISLKNVVVELLWFLRGDTNIKYLIDNGCNIWNQDAYNFYVKTATQLAGFENYEIFHPISTDDWDKTPLFGSGGGFRLHSYGEFTSILRTTELKDLPKTSGYTLGDCGKQYGWLWRDWEGHRFETVDVPLPNGEMLEDVLSMTQTSTDQIKELIDGLKRNPMSRRHIITAWNPTTLDDMALNACHALVQFNCRPIPWEVKLEMAKRHSNVEMETLAITQAAAGNPNFGPIPQYYLDCQMYQRSADVFLGVPYNIASYSLLVHILCELVNMIPGEFIHTFGDVHIYDNHMEQVDLQLSRSPRPLGQLNLSDYLKRTLKEEETVDGWVNKISYSDFGIDNYNPHPSIPAILSTGLK